MRLPSPPRPVDACASSVRHLYIHVVKPQNSCHAAMTRSAEGPDRQPLILGETSRLRICRKKASLTTKVVAGRTDLSVVFSPQAKTIRAYLRSPTCRTFAGATGRPVFCTLDSPECDTGSSRQSKRGEFTISKRSLTYERVLIRFPGIALRSVSAHDPPGHRTEPVSHEGEDIVCMLCGALTVVSEG